MKDFDRIIKVLAANILARRRDMSLSQEELAHYAGIDVRYLGGIERGQRNPSLKVIASIASILNTTVTEILSDNKY